MVLKNENSSQKRNNEIIKLFNDGENLCNIRDRYKLSVSRIHRILLGNPYRPYGSRKFLWNHIKMVMLSDFPFCSNCAKKEKIGVYQIDGNNKNRKWNNLIVLCVTCRIKEVYEKTKTE